MNSRTVRVLAKTAIVILLIGCFILFIAGVMSGDWAFTLAMMGLATVSIIGAVTMVRTLPKE
jgi:hypothetical protein